MMGSGCDMKKTDIYRMLADQHSILISSAKTVTIEFNSRYGYERAYVEDLNGDKYIFRWDADVQGWFEE